MAQQYGTLVKSDDVSWMPRTHMVEEEMWLPQVVP